MRLTPVMDLPLLVLFVLAYGAMGSVLGLSGAHWHRRREKRLLKTFLFFAYLTLLFLFSGMRFGIETLTDWSTPRTSFAFEVLERIALASLIYFLPATINYILGRSWTSVRLARVFIAAVVYLVGGITSVWAGNALLPGLLAVLAFLLIVLFVLVDASRSLPMVEDETTRVALFLLFGLTFLYLPLAQVLPLAAPGWDEALFLSGSAYYLVLGITADIFYIRALSRWDGEDSRSESDRFRDSCSAAGLTPRESEIASLIARGASYKEIAAELSISPNTVSNHVATIYRKTSTRSKVEMVNALRTT